MDKALRDKGLANRKAVLGEAYVEQAIAAADPFNAPFQEILNEYCWGLVWGDERLPRVCNRLSCGGQRGFRVHVQDHPSDERLTPARFRNRAHSSRGSRDQNAPAERSEQEKARRSDQQ